MNWVSSVFKCRGIIMDLLLPFFLRLLHETHMHTYVIIQVVMPPLMSQSLPLLTPHSG